MVCAATQFCFFRSKLLKESQVSPWSADRPCALRAGPRGGGGPRREGVTRTDAGGGGHTCRHNCARTLWLFQYVCHNPAAFSTVNVFPAGPGARRVHSRASWPRVNKNGKGTALAGTSSIAACTANPPTPLRALPASSRAWQRSAPPSRPCPCRLLLLGMVAS